MIKVLYVPDYKEQKYGPFIQRLVKYADGGHGELLESLGGRLVEDAGNSCF